MEQQAFRCSGDCLKCNPIQRQYCATQFTYNTMRMIEGMQGALSVMQGSIEELRVKIDAIQGNEATLFDPTKEEKSEIPNLPIAQSGAGAENRSPETI